jgi:hypothetical protein
MCRHAKSVAAHPVTAEAMFKAGHARRVDLSVGIPAEKVELFYRRIVIWVVNPNHRLCGDGF